MNAAILLMAAVSAARGTSFIFSKQLMAGDLEPLNLLGVRSLIAFGVLMIFYGSRVIRAIRGEVHNLIAGAVLGFLYFVIMVLELNGLQQTTAATASFFENPAVVLVPLAEAGLLRRLPDGRTILCSVLSLIGIGFIAAGGFSAGFGTGEILCSIVALLYTGVIIITDREAKKYDPFVIGILYVGFMGLFGIVGSFLTETVHMPVGMSQWFQMLMLAVICSSFGFAFQPVAQRTISTETAGLLTALNPLTTAVCGILILGEEFGPAKIIGACLILTGIVLHNVKGAVTFR